jgi:hypothetical protein
MPVTGTNKIWHDMILINGRGCSWTFLIGLHTKFHKFTSNASTVNCCQIESQKTFCILQKYFLSETSIIFLIFFLFNVELQPKSWLVAQTTTYTIQHTQEMKIHVLSGVRIRNPRNRAATGIGFYTNYHTPVLDHEMRSRLAARPS